MSKLTMYDFLCAEHGLFEDLVNPEIHQAPCPKCGTNAKRQISAVRIDKTGMALQDGATPTSIDHFERVHRQRRAIEERAFERNGDYGVHAGSDGGVPVTREIASNL